MRLLMLHLRDILINNTEYASLSIVFIDAHLMNKKKHVAKVSNTNKNNDLLSLINLKVLKLLLHVSDNLRSILFNYARDS